MLPKSVLDVSDISYRLCTCSCLVCLLTDIPVTFFMINDISTNVYLSIIDSNYKSAVCILLNKRSCARYILKHGYRWNIANCDLTARLHVDGRMMMVQISQPVV